VKRAKLVRSLQIKSDMRVLGMLGLAGSVVLVSATASAGGRHGGSDDGPTVRDHRSHSDDSHDAPTVRDHRTHDGDSHDAPTVRDHRTHDDGPVVRDHRSHDDGPRVRDHRGSDDVYYVSSGDEVYVSDGGGGSSGGGDPFANMSGPTWHLELGGFAQRFRGPSINRHGSVETTWGDMADYGLASGTPTQGDTAGGGFQMRFTVQASEHLYAGAELGIGGLTRTPIEFMGDPDIHVSSRSLIVPAAVFGTRAGAGVLELDAEVAGGARIVSTTVQDVDAYEDDPSETESAIGGLLEARLRGIVWVSPHVYLAAQAGVGVLERSDVNVGLSIGLSSRPFGNAR
jgi:hypothetical protein